MDSTNDDFFTHLTPIESFNDVPDPAGYSAAPANWMVVITDVEGSTKAIEAGRYKHVNALGVGSIVALQNACKGIELPFVFGGDGATLLCPSSRLEAIKDALRGIRRRSQEGFALTMRVGVVPIQELHDAGHEVLVARYQQNENLSLAMFAGSGIAEAENWVKKRGDQYLVDDDDAESQADFTGFECRWSPIQSRRGVMISLLVSAFGKTPTDRSRVYQQVIGVIDSIVDDEGRPVAEETMTVANNAEAFSTEVTMTTGRKSGPMFKAARTKLRVKAAIGGSTMESGKTRFGFDGKAYRKEAVANTDFRKFDEMLRMVLDVTTAQHGRIENALKAEMDAGRLVYGIHTATSALLTCMIEDREGDHVHFVDGADGGYALAAKVLKERLATRG